MHIYSDKSGQNNILFILLHQDLLLVHKVLSIFSNYPAIVAGVKEPIHSLRGYILAIDLINYLFK